MFIQRHKITAAEEMAEAVVAPEATDLLFEAEDVAELVAEVTGLPVEVSADEDSVVFAVGEDEYTVHAEGNEEILQAVRKPFARKKTVSASTRMADKSTGRTVRTIQRPRTK